MPPQFTDEHEFLPGSERGRPRYRNQHYPVRIGEIVTKGAMDASRNVFPFVSWAIQERFQYPVEAEGFLSYTDSAAEAFFAREFTLRQGVTYPKAGVARCGEIWVQLQRQVARFFLDVAIAHGDTRLAIEIDGFAYHGASAVSMEADYRRQRCLVLNGYYVIRFGAKDVMHDPAGCWAEVDAILDALSAGRK